MKFVALIVVISTKRKKEAITIAKERGAESVTIIKGKHLGKKFNSSLKNLLGESVCLLLFLIPRKLSLKVIKDINEIVDSKYQISDDLLQYAKSFQRV